MQKFKVFSKLSLFLLWGLFLVLTAGCGLKGLEMVTLQEDAAIESDSGFKSVAFWRVRTIDKTREWNNSKPYSLMLKDGYWWFFYNKIDALVHNWRLQEDAAYYDEIFTSKAEPGDYEIWKFIFYHPTVAGTGYESRFGAEFSDVAWKISPGVLAYLGTIDIEITEKTTTKDSRSFFKYNYKIIQSPQQLKEALAVFKEKYPLLYDQFKNNVVTVPMYLFYEGFGGNTVGRWIEANEGKYYDAEFLTGEYVINNKHDNATTIMVDIAAQLPENFDMELESEWEEGIQNRGYGLAFGSDFKNSYRFLVSANGHVSIGLLADDKVLQPMPMAWKQAAAVFKGDGGFPNKQRIEVRGNTIRYYVNRTLVGTIQNNMKTKADKLQIGVTVEGKQEVSFDRLKIIDR